MWTIPLVAILVLNVNASCLSLQLIVHFLKGYSKYYSWRELQNLQLKHTELPRDGYDTTVFPCGCTEDVKVLAVAMLSALSVY